MNMKPAILWEPVDTQQLFDKAVIPVIPLFLSLEEYEQVVMTGGDVQGFIRAYFSRSKIAVCALPDTLEVIIFIVKRRHDKKAILRQALSLYDSYIHFEADAPLSRVSGLIRVVVMAATELTPVPATVFHGKSRNVQISTGVPDYDRLVFALLDRPDYAKYTGDTLKHPGVRSSLETKLRVDLRMMDLTAYVSSIVIVGKRALISLEVIDDGEEYEED